MKFRKIIGIVLVILGVLCLWTASNLSKYTYTSYMTWDVFKFYILGFAFAIPGAFILVPAFTYGRLFNPTLKNFPEVHGVQIKSIHYVPSTKYYGSYSGDGNFVGGSYDRKNWYIIVQNKNAQKAHATLNFSLINNKGITQRKTSLYYELDPQELVEQKLSPYGNMSRREGETIILKSIDVIVGFETKTHELNQKIGTAGNDRSRTIVMLAVVVIIIYLVYRSGIF